MATTVETVYLKLQNLKKQNANEVDIQKARDEFVKSMFNCDGVKMNGLLVIDQSKIFKVNSETISIDDEYFILEANETNMIIANVNPNERCCCKLLMECFPNLIKAQQVIMTMCDKIGFEMKFGTELPPTLTDFAIAKKHVRKMFYEFIDVHECGEEDLVILFLCLKKYENRVEKAIDSRSSSLRLKCLKKKKIVLKPNCQTDRFLWIPLEK